jgi:MtrB/PioB family decaheme-associated outer membrane protein
MTMSGCTSRKKTMSAGKSPLRHALLVAALMQAFPLAALAAADAKDAKDAKAGKDAKATKDDDKGKACEDCPDYSGWSKWLEIGAGYQSDDSYHFGRYNGVVDKGAFLNASGEATYRGKGDGEYLNAKALDLGLDSRSVAVEAGKQGKYGVAVEYEQIPNFRRDYPGASLKTERDRTGLRFSTVPGRDWEITGFYRHEEKDGTKDVGAVVGFTTPRILPVDFNYETNDFGLNLGYKGERLQAQIAYAGSLFNNDKNKIAWSNPLPPPDTGQMAEAPDNQFHQISALLGYQLTDTTRVGAKLAFGRMTQDQNFLPYTVNPATITGPLPSSSLDGRVDTTLVKLDVNSRPIPKLRLEASYTYSDRDNKTSVDNWNYVVTDTALASDAYAGFPLAGRPNRPYSFEQNLLRLKAGYRLPMDADLSGGFDYDKMERTYQLVEETKDKTLWAKLKLHPMEAMETALKVSHADRDASNPKVSSWQAASQNPVYPNSGITYPGMTLPNPLMRPFELAERSRDKVGLDVSYSPQDRLTLGFALDYYKDDYKHMELGLTEAKGLSVTPSVTYAFSENLSATAYYSYEKLDSDQNGREWITAPPSSTLWAESDSNETQTVGLGVNWKAIPNKLEVGADAVYADFSCKIRYADSPDLPELSSTLTAIGVHGIYKMSDTLSLRANYWYERYKESDWANVDMPYALGTYPQKQETHVIYLAARYEFK